LEDDKNYNEISNIFYNSQENLEKSSNKADNGGDPFPQDVSRVSHVSQIYNSGSGSSSSVDFPTKCYSCDFTPSNKQQYDDHCSLKHRGFSGSPNKAGLEAYGLKSQGKDWEK
jgi:hypothetical protein